MKDLFVRRTYTKNGITIVVDLDFIKKTISLVEKDGSNKKWVFVDRTPEYMNSWVAILDAMQYAVDEAHKLMDSIQEEEHKEFVKVYVQLDKAVAKKGGR